MRILGSIVQPFSCLLNGFITDHLHRGAVRPEFISHNYFRLPVTLHRFSQKTQCCLTVPSLSNKHFKNLTFMVNGSPQVTSFSVDLDEDFIHMPSPLNMGTH